MTEGLLGVLIGAAIGIFGSIVIETIRARYQRKENSKKYLVDILEKRKAALLEILEHFRRLHADIFIWKTDPGNKINPVDQWDSLTGFMPHLAILPEPFPSFVRDMASKIYKWSFDNEKTVPTTDAGADTKAINKNVSDYFIKVTERITREILLIDAEIIGVFEIKRPNPFDQTDNEIQQK